MRPVRENEEAGTILISEEGCRKARDEKASIQLDAQKRRNCTGAFDLLQGQWDPQAGGGGPDGAKVVVAFPGVRSTGC